MHSRDLRRLGQEVTSFESLSTCLLPEKMGGGEGDTFYHTFNSFSLAHSMHNQQQHMNNSVPAAAAAESTEAGRSTSWCWE